MERDVQAEGSGSTSASSGALGPDLAEAISDYQRCLANAARAETEYATAQRAVSEARARLTALRLGARVTGSRALVAVSDPDEGAPAAQLDTPRD